MGLGAVLGVALTASLAQAQAPGSDLLVPGLSAAAAAGPRRTPPPPPPSVDVDAELIFQVLASEVAAQRGAYAAAIGTSLELARYTRDPRLARRAVEFALAGGDMVRALDASQLWAELDPSDAEARQTALSLAAAAGKVDNLGATLRSRIAAAPDKGAAVIDARRILGRLEDRKRALAILEEAVRDVPNLPETRVSLARFAAMAGDMPRALREIQAAQAQQPQSEAIAAQALQYGIEVEPDRAIAGARAFIVSNPPARELRLMLVRALVTVKDFNGAQAELQSMANADPSDAEVVYMQGAVAYRAGDLDAADRFLQRYQAAQGSAAGATPGGLPPLADGDSAVFMRAQIAEDQNRLDDAYELLNQVDDPSAALDARLRQAVLRGKQGRIDDARKLIALIDPRDEREAARTALTESQILRNAGQRDEAIKVLQAASGKYPENTALLYDLGMLYEQQNRVADMESTLRRVIALDPGHAQAYNALGYSLADRNMRLSEAKALIERALNLQPDDPFIIDSMGWVLYRMGDNTGAIKYLKRAYGIRPDAEIGVHLGEVLWAAGEQGQARELWRSVQQKDPSNEVLKSTLARLAVTL
ncbi:tetratricopeptide repeat protein [Pigmentiphaga soli]|uniref:Tetratricopeptide repeat protein n=1 Tax=Pigmentiphaga soli TaxID=1007095 RepID=A0ABP8HGX9_9BURK